MAGVSLAGRSFLDIGFGQGLGLLSAASMGAEAVGCDINPKCAEVLARNRMFFPNLPTPPKVVVGSILESGTVERLRAASPGQSGFAVVHSWGVLHHTGDMANAIRNAAGLVAENGHLVIAIYNRHWSSPAWKVIKAAYVRSPEWLRRILIGLFYPVIYCAKWLVTRRNPRSQERGMDFYYDVVDWVGGYPYEFEGRDGVEQRLARLGFVLVRSRAAAVPTGCNEFVFVRQD